MLSQTQSWVMSGTDLDTARTRLALYLQAEASILSGAQEFTTAGRKWRKADLAEIRSAIREVRSEIADLEGQASGGSRLYTIVPR